MALKDRGAGVGTWTGSSGGACGQGEGRRACGGWSCFDGGTTHAFGGGSPRGRQAGRKWGLCVPELALDVFPDTTRIVAFLSRGRAPFGRPEKRLRHRQRSLCGWSATRHEDLENGRIDDVLLEMCIGPGIVEGSCQTVVGQCLKQSRMFWSVEGGNEIPALRCAVKRGRYEDLWELKAARDRKCR